MNFLEEQDNKALLSVFVLKTSNYKHAFLFNLKIPSLLFATHATTWKQSPKALKKKDEIILWELKSAATACILDSNITSEYDNHTIQYHAMSPDICLGLSFLHKCFNIKDTNLKFRKVNMTIIFIFTILSLYIFSHHLT